MSQTQIAIDQTIARPLTTLSEDEQMFRASVREFAEGELRKRVEKMDEQGHFDPELMNYCFDLGLMGIETPEEFGGAGGSFFRRSWRSKSCRASMLRWASLSMCRIRWSTTL